MADLNLGPATVGRPPEPGVRVLLLRESRWHIARWSGWDGGWVNDRGGYIGNEHPVCDGQWWPLPELEDKGHG